MPGFVVDCRLDGDARVVTFFTGSVQREPVVDLDDEARRLDYGAIDSPLGATHYTASAQVIGDGEVRVPRRVDRRFPARRTRRSSAAS